MAVDVRMQRSFSAGTPLVLFEGRYAGTGAGVPGYDISPDGKRFLRVQLTSPEASQTQVNLILNWTEELKRLVPTK